MTVVGDGIDERTAGVVLVATLAGLQGVEAGYHGLVLLGGGVAVTVLAGPAGAAPGVAFVALSGVLVAVGLARMGAAKLLWNGEWFGWLGVTVLTGAEVLLSGLLFGTTLVSSLSASPLLPWRVVVNALALAYLVAIRGRFDNDRRENRRAYFRRVYGPADDPEERERG